MLISVRQVINIFSYFPIPRFSLQAYTFLIFLESNQDTPLSWVKYQEARINPHSQSIDDKNVFIFPYGGARMLIEFIEKIYIFF